MIPAWGRKYAGTPSSETPRFDIDALIHVHGLRRDQAVELQNHFFDLRRAQPDAAAARQFEQALQVVRAGGFEDRRELARLRGVPFIVVFDLDDTLYDQYSAREGCSDFVVAAPGQEARHVKLAPGWQRALETVTALGGAVVLFSANLDDATRDNLRAWQLGGASLLDHPLVAGVLTNSHLVQESALPPEGERRRHAVTEPSKDLRIFDPELRRVIIVDDNPRRLMQLRNARVTKKFHADRYCGGDPRERAMYESTLPTVTREIEEAAAYARARGVDFVTAYLPYSALGQLAVQALVASGLAPEAARARVREAPALVDAAY